MKLIEELYKSRKSFGVEFGHYNPSLDYTEIKFYVEQKEIALIVTYITLAESESNNLRWKYDDLCYLSIKFLYPIES